MIRKARREGKRIIRHCMRLDSLERNILDKFAKKLRRMWRQSENTTQHTGFADSGGVSRMDRSWAYEK